MLNQRARQRPAPHLLWRRTLALAGSLVVHVLFLFAFILGPAWEPPSRPVPSPQLKAHFIELPDLAPPPPKGAPPRQVGPVHRGHAASASVRQAVAVPPPSPAQARAPKVKAAAAPPAAPSLPQPAPSQAVQPVPLASQPPPVELAKPTLEPPVPPKFQPQPLRAPQLEGKQAMPPPPSLAQPITPSAAPPSITAPSVALDRVAPKATEAALAPLTHAELSAPPPAPALEAVPLAAPKAPAVSLDTHLRAPVPPAPAALPKLQALAPVAEPPLAAIPQTAAPTPTVAPVATPALKPVPAAALAAPVVLAPVAMPPEVAADAAASAAPASATADHSSAPDASPQGSDSAPPGQPQGVAGAAATATVHGHGMPASHGLSPALTASGKASSGKASDALPGAANSANGLPDYIQLKPTGNTTVMSHKLPGVKYQPTRFEPDWAPEGESTVDTALRRAAEKTTVQHTFHLPRGIRIKCSAMPLVPVALLGCANADPPPAPAAQQVYDRLNLPAAPGGSVPAVTSSPATTASVARAAPVVLDNAALCAAARVAGGPLPPACPVDTVPASSLRPASAASTWAPASDQFH